MGYPSSVYCYIHSRHVYDEHKLYQNPAVQQSLITDHPSLTYSLHLALTLYHQIAVTLSTLRSRCTARALSTIVHTMRVLALTTIGYLRPRPDLCIVVDQAFILSKLCQ